MARKQATERRAAAQSYHACTRGGDCSPYMYAAYAQVRKWHTFPVNGSAALRPLLEGKAEAPNPEILYAECHRGAAARRRGRLQSWPRTRAGLNVSSQNLQGFLYQRLEAAVGSKAQRVAVERPRSGDIGGHATNAPGRQHNGITSRRAAADSPQPYPSSHGGLER